MMNQHTGWSGDVILRGKTYSLVGIQVDGIEKVMKTHPESSGQVCEGHVKVMFYQYHLLLLTVTSYYL